MNTPLTIAETQARLKRGDFSASQLVDEYLTRINNRNKELNIFLTVSDNESYKRAGQIDKTIKELGKEAFQRYPLLGVTISYKDIFLTKGIRTTAGSKVLENYIPAYSSTVVNRLNNAGCITLGKTNLDAWAHGSSGENSDFKPTKNPWNMDYVPGGSSSGSGSALSADLSLISTGTDTCGSIRLPANYNYIYGFKPTYGSVSRYGIIAMASSLDSIGHFGHTVDDIEKVLEVTKGEDGKDSTLKNYDFVKSKARLKLGIPKEFFSEGLDKEVERTILNAIQILKKEGIELVDISLPHTKYAIAVYYIVQPAEVSSNLSRFDGIRYGNDRNSFGAEAVRRIMLGTYVLSAGYYDAFYLKAMKVRSLIRQEVDKAFEKVDAIIAPVAPTPPFKLGEKISDPLKMYLTDIFAATANLTGIPSLAVPFGFSKKGLPLGFQLMGSRFSEKTLFELARLFEKSTNYQPKVA